MTLQLQAASSYFWLLFFGACCVQYSSTALLSGSQIEVCTQTSLLDQSCESKLVVTLTVDANQNGTETVEAMLDRTTDASGKEFLFDEPIRIRMSRTETSFRYPITFFQTFNNKPSEQIRYGSTCDDDEQSSSATCGWYMDNGQRVPYSQGFCCSCDLSDLIGSDSFTRSNLDCTPFGSRTHSAHCLRFDELWYRSYEVGAPTPDFEIDVSIDLPIADDGANVTSEVLFELSPETSGFSYVASSIGTIQAELVGLLESFEGVPQLSNKYLMVPSFPLTHERVSQPIGKWMLIDRHRVTTDGTECNKIGVSFEAFRFQSNACERIYGSCLHNQLDDLYEADSELAERSEVGNYFLENYGTFESDTTSSSTPKLVYKSDATQAALVVLSIPAAALRFVQTRSGGEIDAALIEPFETLSKNGFAFVNVTNTGDIAADFTVSVSDCPPYIARISSRQKTIQPNHTVAYTFQLFSETVFPETASCVVKLYDAQMFQIDDRQVFFNTTALRSRMGGQGEGDGTDDIDPYDLYDPALTCQQCSFINVLCLTLNGCWGGLLRSFFGLSGGALSIFVLVKFKWARAFVWKLITGVLFCGFCRKKKDNKGRKGKDNERKTSGAKKDKSSGKSSKQRAEKKKKGGYSSDTESETASYDDDSDDSEAFERRRRRRRRRRERQGSNRMSRYFDYAMKPARTYRRHYEAVERIMRSALHPFSAPATPYAHQQPMSSPYHYQHPDDIAEAQKPQRPRSAANPIPMRDLMYIATHQMPVYLNVSDPETSFLKGAGTQYTLLGQVAVTENGKRVQSTINLRNPQLVFFVPSKSCFMHLRYSTKKQRYIPLQTAKPIDPQLLVSEMSLSDAMEFLTLAPVYTVVNAPPSQDRHHSVVR